MFVWEVTALVDSLRHKAAQRAQQMLRLLLGWESGIGKVLEDKMLICPMKLHLKVFVPTVGFGWFAFMPWQCLLVCFVARTVASS